MLASLAFLYVDKCTDHKNAEVARPFGPRPLFKVFFLKKNFLGCSLRSHPWYTYDFEI